MTHNLEPSNGGPGSTAQEECILCKEQHKQKKEEPPPDHTFVRQDRTLEKQGRAYIKTDSLRALFYPKDDDGNFVSPLEKPKWSADEIFNTYKTKNSGKTRRRPKEYQPPPIHGYIAAPHHMISVCSMNGTNDLPAVPRINPWAFKADYNINRGENCIFLPSSASQFYTAYYYWKVRKTGQPLQGHLGNHRKEYFEEIWNRLEQMAEQAFENGWCTDTSTPAKKDALAERLLVELGVLETTVFGKLAAKAPEDRFKLGAESYIEIPAEDQDFHIPEGVQERLLTYEILPQWYT